jgi:hypothetical protein
MVRFNGDRRNQAHHVELVRLAKENALVVQSLAFGREHCPCGVESGQAQGFGVFRLVFEPARDMIGVAAFSERFEREGFEFTLDGETIDQGGFFGRISGESFFLDEFAFDGVERREFVVLSLKIVKRFIDAEEMADEVFEMRRDGDDEFGFLFLGERERVFSCSEELGVELRRGLPELRQKNAVETGEGVVIVEIPERESKGQSKGAVTPRIILFIHDMAGVAAGRGPKPLSPV